MTDSARYASLHVLGSRQYGGADQFYVRLLRALFTAGCRVTAVNRPDSPVAKALEADPIEQIHLPLANQWDIWSAWRIHRVALRRSPCIVQTYMGRATRLTRFSPRSAVVHIARLGGYYKIDGYYRHAHAWVGNTRGICDYLIRSGLPAERVFQIGNFVPTANKLVPLLRAECRRKHDVPVDAFVIFAMGRLISKKGFDDLLKAFAMLPRELNGQPLRLVIAGSGTEGDALKSLSGALGLNGRVVWLGWQNPNDYLAAADLFVCPSRHEPLGNVILEAWSHALPVVSTATDGALELIEDGQTGLLAAPSDPCALAARVRDAIEAPEAQRMALGQAGQNLLAARFSQKAVVAAYLDLYAQQMIARGW